MKTRYTSKELPHIFCNLTPEEATTSAGTCPANESFRNGAYYSYGTVIARWIDYKGKRALLVNSSGYSISTTRHQSALRRAIPPGVVQFKISGLGRGECLRQDGPALYDWSVKAAAEFEDKATRARGEYQKSSHMQQSQVYLKQAQTVSDFFGLRRKVNAKSVERVRKAAKLANKKAEKGRQANFEKRATEIERRKVEQRGAYDAWKSGENEGVFWPDNFPTAFRVERDTERGMELTAELVSTHGARVPLDAARVALRFILRKRGTDWHRNGETCPVGSYQLDAINAQGVVAGCHRFNWEEVERVAAMLNEKEVEA